LTFGFELGTPQNLLEHISLIDAVLKSGQFTLRLNRGGLQSKILKTSNFDMKNKALKKILL